MYSIRFLGSVNDSLPGSLQHHRISVLNDSGSLFSSVSLKLRRTTQLCYISVQPWKDQMRSASSCPLVSQ
jgi:hypothetical protein